LTTEEDRRRLVEAVMADFLEKQRNALGERRERVAIAFVAALLTDPNVPESDAIKHGIRHADNFLALLDSTEFGRGRP
jgi:hypothetical protein